jgi:hypothetical protein
LQIVSWLYLADFPGSGGIGERGLQIDAGKLCRSVKLGRSGVGSVQKA